MSAVIDSIAVRKQVSQTSTLSSESRSGVSGRSASRAQHARRSGSATGDKSRGASPASLGEIGGMLLVVILGA